MPKLLMHIGTHKTGSSTFQTICRNNAELLRDGSVCFPSYEGWEQHSYAAWAWQKGDAQDQRAFLEIALHQAAQSQSDVVLVSGEDFENFLIDTHLAQSFSNLARELGFSEIEWIVVRRDPFDYLQSIYAEFASYGVVLDLERMAEAAVSGGCFSLSSGFYDYKFVFAVADCADGLATVLGQPVRVINFGAFTRVFAGQVVLKEYLDSARLDTLRARAREIGKVRVRDDPEIVEIRYACAFLGVKASQAYYAENKTLIDQLVAIRLDRNQRLLPLIEEKFRDQFAS